MEGRSTVSAPEATRALRRSRAAVTAVFATQGMFFASWTAHIPLVASRLGMDNGTLGTALLGAPLGSVLAMIVTGLVLARLGSVLVVRVTVAGYLISGCALGLASSAVELFAALALAGFFQGALDVSMNTQGVTVERRYGRPIMSGLHGGWSIGSLIGALIGTSAVALGVGLLPQLIVVGAALMIINAVFTPAMIPDHEQRPERAHRRRVFSPVVLILGGISLACMLCEGASADWSAKYLHSSLGAPAGAAGLAYAAYLGAMVVARLGGGWLLTRFRVQVVLPILATASTIAMIIVLVLGNPVVAVIGYAVLGLGLASVVPAAFSAAGRLSGGNAGGAIATVSAIGWAGFVFGPAAIGHLADLTSLPMALGIIPILTAVIAVGVRFTSAFREPTRQG